MTNRDYWKRRMEILETAQIKKGQEYLETLERQYRIASKNIEKELANWYRRFATNNKITMTEARRLLTTRELREFKWDVYDYIKHAEESVTNKAWLRELENAAARVNISRLESIQLQLQQQVEVLFGNQLDGVDKLLRQIYSDGFYRTCWEVQRGFKVGWNLNSINSNQLDRILSRPWVPDGRTFSQRIWTDQQRLIGSLQTHLSQAAIRGDSPDRAIKSIANEFRMSKNRAGRLVMTESAAFASRAQQDAFRELDVERFEFLATLDMHTSEICQEFDGKVLEMTHYEVGVTAPPLHPWCRSTTIPFFDDNYGERAARGKDGKTYYVPSNMTYKEWYSKHVVES